MSDLPWSSVELLAPHHDLTAFSCGLDAVDEWFRRNAHTESASGRVATHVCLDPEGAVLAFFSLKHTVLHVENSSKTMQRTAETEGYATALLLAQMGVDQTCQGGAGKTLMTAVFELAIKLHRQAPFKHLITDAATLSLVQFYAKFGMHPISPDSRRLYIKTSSVMRALAE